MSVSYSSNLGLALPAQGDWAGTWGTYQNSFITQYLDAAIAGAQTISGSQTAVTLSTNNGTNLTQAGSGSTGSAQYQIINCTGNPASALTVTVPNTSKAYLVINATSTSQTVTVKAAATTGVTVASGKAALIAWNGSDFILISTNDASKITGILAVANGGTGVTTSTGSGSVVLSTSPTLVSPALGTPTSGNFSSGTFTWPTFNQNTTGSAGSVANAVTFNNSGAGVGSSSTYNGSTAITVSYNTIGAPSTTGTNASGTWSININGTVGATTPATGTFTRLRSGTSGTIIGSGTLTPASDSYNQYNVQVSGGSATFAAPSGTPADSQKLLIRIVDDGTARALTWNAIYRAIGITLPSTTVATKLTYVGCVYNSTDTKWDVIFVTTQA